MILVVGATGQLGAAVTQKLITAGHRVRALVRPSSRTGHLHKMGAELILGDLRDSASLQAACQGVRVVVATANAVIRPRGDNFKSVEDVGYRNLIASAENSDIQQFVFTSVPDWPGASKTPALKYKRLTEERLQQSRLPHTIVRLSVFMDVWLALLGSHIPTRGSIAPTVARPFWFSRVYLALIGGMIEKRGMAIVPGSGRARHAFITVADAARVVANTVDHPEADQAILHVGGPEILSWNEAITIFEDVLDRRIKRIPFPAALAQANRGILSAFAEGPANIMGMMATVATHDSAFPPADAKRFLKEPMTTIGAYLKQKRALAERSPALASSNA